MALNTLTNKPVPPDSTVMRGMYLWVPAAPNNPLDTLAEQQTIITFCGTYYVNCIFLDIYRYLGGDNWSNNNVLVIRHFLEACHASGIQVHAVAGDVGYGTAQNWVMTNIVRPVSDFNAKARYSSQRFDGLHYDVEYWTDEVTYPPATNLPGLCDLMVATRRVCGPGFKVSCFSASHLKDNTATRTVVTYRGNDKQDGAHMMDVADFVVVATYADSGANQITLFQPWYDYASVAGVNAQLFAASETTNVAPGSITYYGDTKTNMATAHAAIASAFRAGGNSVFLGQVVHDYVGWSAMT